MQRERRLAAPRSATRIARDLHDSAAHAINVILVQAGAARLLQQQRPRRASRGRCHDRERRARDDRRDRPADPRPTADDDLQHIHGTVEPPAGLAALGTLAERYRAAGQAVELHLSGRSPPAGARPSTRPPTGSCRSR